jgi:hypothetical protein
MIARRYGVNHATVGRAARPLEHQDLPQCLVLPLNRHRRPSRDPEAPAIPRSPQPGIRPTEREGAPRGRAQRPPSEVAFIVPRRRALEAALRGPTASPAVARYVTAAREVDPACPRRYRRKLRRVLTRG